MIHRFIQVAALLYIIVYSIVIREGYQEYSKVSGIVYMKAKGIAYINDPVTGTEIYDSNDLVEPPVEPDALFITAGFVRTIQQRGTCDSRTPCNTPSDCVAGLTSDGELLAGCNSSLGYCTIEGWCPLELDDNSAIIQLQGLESITVFMRSSVKYETFNIFDNDPSDPLLGINLFSLQQILGDRDVRNCSTTGCIVAVQIDWTCNLNKGSCPPKITFVNINGGFNFRKTTYDIAKTTRGLEKLYGVRLLVKIIGTGSRFSFFQMVITVGASAAFITLATVITDLLLIFCCGSENLVTRKKWGHIRFGAAKNTDDDQEVRI